ncbi:MAG: hypothetical protein ACXAC7_09790 [Candidatus Hodarchaeales archaeon]|jgi:hypothetical protein
MFDLIVNRLDRAFELTYSLYSSLEKESLLFKLNNLPSNTIGQQVWCIIGARESYFKAIKRGNWNGFSCSLTDSNKKEDILKSLSQTRNDIIGLLRNKKSEKMNLPLIFDLYEHEIQHHGQLIRYIYANKLKFPKTWNNRYSV